ncbi:MAG: phosphatidylinositol mannoside acyltransferase [Bifidobacteriaceae bacterium]|jgi:KDO2-lipid IV(A) lauroyltransferase|nr:phosphatidylinositol mannoside acyltransferase [Bifidobacteriaceae bacterium]
MAGKINWTMVAWRTVPRLPRRLIDGMFHLIALGAWARRGKGVRQLERNLARVRPDASPRAIRRLSRAGTVAYMRYYGEIFYLPTLTRAQVAARVRPIGVEVLQGAVAKGPNPPLALAHMGNWDMAGAWASQAIGSVTTVAEHLSPEELYQEFLQMRSAIGITILPADRGRTFKPLLDAVTSGPPGIVPVLADRDLSNRGLDVTMFGLPARVAVGPAALACRGEAPLFPLVVYSEKLRGKRRRAAGGPNGYVLEILPEVPHRPDLPPDQEVAAMTQGWVDAIEQVIAAHPADWHMMQKVFVEDLDAAKDATIRGTPT